MLASGTWTQQRGSTSRPTKRTLYIIAPLEMFGCNCRESLLSFTGTSKFTQQTFTEIYLKEEKKKKIKRASVLYTLTSYDS